MRIDFQKLLKLFLLQIRYALFSLIATSVDYAIYLGLVHRLLSPVASNMVSFSIAFVVNFILQRRFVFKLKRPSYHAFFLSMIVSAGGLTLSTGIIYALSLQPFFNERQYITKLVATGIVFFYNFFLKRYVFEKRVFAVD